MVVVVFGGVGGGGGCVVGCWPLGRLAGLGLGIGGGWGACGGWRGTKAGLCGEEEAGGTGQQYLLLKERSGAERKHGAARACGPGASAR